MRLFINTYIVIVSSLLVSKLMWLTQQVILSGAHQQYRISGSKHSTYSIYSTKLFSYCLWTALSRRGLGYIMLSKLESQWNSWNEDQISCAAYRRVHEVCVKIWQFSVFSFLLSVFSFPSITVWNNPVCLICPHEVIFSFIDASI